MSVNPHLCFSQITYRFWRECRVRVLQKHYTHSFYTVASCPHLGSLSISFICLCLAPQCKFLQAGNMTYMLGPGLSSNIDAATYEIWHWASLSNGKRKRENVVKCLIQIRMFLVVSDRNLTQTGLSKNENLLAQQLNYDETDLLASGVTWPRRMMCSGPISLSIFCLHSLLLAPLSNRLSTQSRKVAAQTPIIHMVRLRPSNKENKSLLNNIHIYPRIHFDWTNLGHMLYIWINSCC